jgi:hypothetical protein
MIVCCLRFISNDYIAKAKLAKMSSLSSSGWSSSISSMLISLPKRSKITSTGNRIPLIQGFPWQISGSWVMRVFRFFIDVFFAKYTKYLLHYQEKKNEVFHSILMLSIGERFFLVSLNSATIGGRIFVLMEQGFDF